MLDYATQTNHDEPRGNQMAIVNPKTDNLPYTRDDVSALMDISGDLARTLVRTHGGWVRTLDAEALEALLYDALVELEYALLP